MCLKPLKVRNPTAHITRLGGQLLYLEVPCGKCAECKDTIRQQWHFRSWQQTQDTISRGGYVYYDTLTYSDEHVPHCSDYLNINDKGISDFTCFNVNHWRNFLKNLRRQISYYYKDMVKIKYFLTSEYGTDDRYTHRPHYHILLFVDNKFLHPWKLSRLVSKCWPYGRTDGFPYKPAKYVAENIFGYDVGFGKNLDCLKVCSYVSKYITKDSTFEETIQVRIDKLKEHYDDETLCPILRNINMYHKQSQGFGLAYLHKLDDEELDYIYKTGCCRMMDSDKVKLVIPLPLYYKRKLFYKCLKDADNKYFWQLTQQGIDYKRGEMLNNITRVTNLYKNKLANISLDGLDYIQRLLDDRSIEDFVIYKLFYKGRSRSFDSFSLQDMWQFPTLSDNEYNLCDWLDNLIQSSFYRTDSEYNILHRDRDKNTISIPIAYGDLFNININTKDYDYNSFAHLVTFSEKSCPEFRNFDRLDAFFKLLDKPNNQLKQATFDFIEDIQKRLKLIFK